MREQGYQDSQRFKIKIPDFEWQENEAVVECCIENTHFYHRAPKSVFYAPYVRFNRFLPLRLFENSSEKIGFYHNNIWHEFEIVTHPKTDATVDEQIKNCKFYFKTKKQAKTVELLESFKDQLPALKNPAIPKYNRFWEKGTAYLICLLPGTEKVQFFYTETHFAIYAPINLIDQEGDMQLIKSSPDFYPTFRTPPQGRLVALDFFR